MTEKTIKLFLFENDACFRDKTLTNCKQIITHCEFMLKWSNQSSWYVVWSKKFSKSNCFSFRLNWMTVSCFRTSFSKRLVYIRINRLENSNRWKLVTKFLLIFTIHFRNSIYSTKTHFVEKFINESFNFLLNRTSSYRALIHKFESSKIVAKTLLNRIKFSLLKRLTKFERWIASNYRIRNDKRQLKSTISTKTDLISDLKHISIHNIFQ